MQRRQQGIAKSDCPEAELVCEARAGDAESLGTLAARVSERVRAYLNRVTLDQERSQDLAQDTVVAVLESLGTLRNVERFWPWVFRIASNKARQQYRFEARRRALQMSAIEESHLPMSSDGREEGPGRLLRKELGELTREAMTQVSERYRMVLALRLYEGMPHAEIARALGCTELSARATFFRAKHALMRELRRRGVHKTAFLAALAVFGELTAPSPAAAAAVTVNSAAAAESVVTGLLSAKAKLAAAVIAAMLVSALVWDREPATTPAISSPETPAIRSVHFSHQALASDLTADSRSQSQGCYERWYHFPEGLGGPVLFRMQRWDPKQTQRLCWWVQNGSANYYVHSGKNTIYIDNARLYYAQTTVLPTDSQSFCEFVRELEGEQSWAMVAAPQISYERDRETGFVSSRVDRRFPKLGAFETTYDYADLDVKLFNAPSGMTVVDWRDAMHKRGWTYFRVEGQIGGKHVSGVGRVPFVYEAFKTHGPWLKLEIDGKLAAADNGTDGWLLDDAGRVRLRRPGGSLFRGLSRPWSGFHTLDTIRRDAAAERIWFATGLFGGDPVADVTLVDQGDGQSRKLRYTIDLERDMLTRVELWVDEEGIFDERYGELTFSYLDELEEAGEEFVPPGPADAAPSGRAGEATVLWPLELLPANADKGSPAAAGRSSRRPTTG